MYESHFVLKYLCVPVGKLKYYFAFVVLLYAIKLLCFLNPKEKYTVEPIDRSFYVEPKGISTKQIITTLSYSKKVEIALKYILLWTSCKKIEPWEDFGTQTDIFVAKRCKWDNCYVTSNRSYFEDTSKFDVVFFNGPWLNHMDLPKNRSSKQKYVLGSIESAANYPLEDTWSDFFNWTWTYRLDSDSLWGYIAVRNATKHVIGPSFNMQWMKLTDMNSIGEKLKQKLKSKTKAVAWLASNCVTKSKREYLVKAINYELLYYGLEVDTYGACGRIGRFTRTKDMNDYFQLLEEQYYFYFAFENSLSEDYVTEKVLNALKHNTVPIVFGGADYSRFMPDGIYLDALKLTPKQLALKINEAITHPEVYHDFFRWKNHYSFHHRDEDPETDDYCQFCAILNNETIMGTNTVYEDMRMWWNTNISFRKRFEASAV